MSELELDGSELRNTRSIAFQCFLQYFGEIEKQINSSVGSDSLTSDQLDFVELIFDSFQKLSRLHYTSATVRNLLMLYGFSDSCCISDHNDYLATIRSNASTTKLKLTDKNKNEGQQLAILCDTCEEEVPIINGDLKYSWQLHFRSPYHLEVVSVHRKIQESIMTVNFDSSPSTNSSTNIVLSQGSSSSSNNDPSRRSNTLLKHPKIEDVLGSPPTNANVRSKSKTNQTIKPSSNVHNFDVHVQGLKRRENLKLKRKETASINNKTESDVILSINGIRHCSLCDVSLPSQANFQTHTSSVAHLKKLMSYLRSYLSTNLRNPPPPIKITGSLDYITFHSGKRYCSLCNVQLPGKSQYDGHMNGSLHKRQLKRSGILK